MVRVCLDPGHGGYDPGAIGPTKLKEKDISLAVALETGNFLQSAGCEVVFTRIDDQVSWFEDANQDLFTRCKIANLSSVDLFVSIHCNSASNPDAHGTETYSYAASDTGQGAEAAQLIQTELVNALGLPNRGTKTANFYVLRETKAPAVLTELAFISNPQEEQLLNQKDFQVKAAKAIALAVTKYFGLKLPPQEHPPVSPRLVINGQLTTSVPLCIIDGKTYVELRSFLKATGGEVKWDESTKTITVILKPK
jgi:N-acetylmuramoyl-L-alanine amidase